MTNLLYRLLFTRYLNVNDRLQHKKHANVTSKCEHFKVFCLANCYCYWNMIGAVEFNNIYEFKIDLTFFLIILFSFDRIIA